MNKIDEITLVEITGEGCASCERLMYDLSDIAENMNVKFLSYDIGKHPELIDKWQIERVPAFLILVGETPISKSYGWQPREILEIYIEEKIKEYGKEN